MTKRLTFNQALQMADTVECLVRGPGCLIPVKISKAAARRDIASKLKGYPARKMPNVLDDLEVWISVAEPEGLTLWSLEPEIGTLTIG